jgi:FdhD protein
MRCLAPRNRQAKSTLEQIRPLTTDFGGSGLGRGAPFGRRDRRAGGRWCANVVWLSEVSAFRRSDDPVGNVTARRRATHVTAGQAITRPETLAVEEPLEIRVNGTPVTVTMRTPGSDIELAQGFLLTEGVIARREDVLTIRYCGGRGENGANTYNVLDVTLAPGVKPPGLDVTRNFYTTSSCGVCGKASLDAVRVIGRFTPADDRVTVTPATLKAMPAQLRSAQKVFDSTGGLHAAALFDADGTMLAVREDIGRHNAVDKVVGWALEHERIPAAGSVLLVSGRASFEITQKAVLAGIPVLAAVSAPSSLAVSLAEEFGVTLVAFLRAASMNVYTRADRIT